MANTRKPLTLCDCAFRSKTAVAATRVSIQQYRMGDRDDIEVLYHHHCLLCGQQVVQTFETPKTIHSGLFGCLLLGEVLYIGLDGSWSNEKPRMPKGRF